MANHDRRVMPGDLLAYEEWAPERGKILLVLNVAQRTTTCIRSDGLTVVERPAALRTATRLVADGMRT